MVGVIAGQIKNDLDGAVALGAGGGFEDGAAQGTTAVGGGVVDAAVEGACASKAVVGVVR